MAWARPQVVLYLKKWLPAPRKGLDEDDSDGGSEDDSEAADFIQKMEKRHMKNN